MGFMMAQTTADAAATGGGGSLIAILLMYGVILGGGYFIFMRPKRKEQKKLQAMLTAMAVGDYVLTNAGFYGVIIDISGDTVIVEFGNNKNCRIPMQKVAIASVEKASEA
jgi:preprotein translocase subunit YajC